LDLIFCIKKERTVNNDNTIVVYGQVIQIPPTNRKLSLARSKVDVCLLEDKRLFILYKGIIVAQSLFSAESKVAKKEANIEALLSQREYTSVRSAKGV
jgi:hypothetical protein